MSDDGAIPVAIGDDETAAVSSPSDGRDATIPSRRATLKILTGPQAGRLFVVGGDQLVVGRGADIDVQIDDSALSRRHFRIARAGATFTIEDLGSRNGTRVDGQRLTGVQPLGEGAMIQPSPSTVLKFSIQNELEVRAEQRLYESAVLDPLTGLHNRRHLDQRMRAEVAFAARHSSSLSFMIIDVDHFKKINDTMGHAAGDAALRALAEQLQRSVRTEDLVARYGGEEFAVIARGIAAPGARLLAERIREMVARMRVPYEAATLNFTVSIGLVTMDAAHLFPTAHAMFKAADELLYQAKAAGRNRCAQKD